VPARFWTLFRKIFFVRAPTLALTLPETNQSQKQLRHCEGAGRL